MSIHAAIAALGKEIDVVEKKRVRLETMRDALVVEAQGAEVAIAASTSAKKGKPGPKPGAGKKGKPGPKPGAKKATTTTEALAAKKTAAPKKRVMSAEAKKKIGDAVRARWAKKTVAAKRTA